LTNFNTLCTNKNRKKYSIRELQNLQHYHNCISTLPEKIKKHTKQHDCGRPLPASRSIERVMRNLRRKSSSIHCFQFLLGYFLNNLLAENLLHSHRFWIKKLSLKLNIMPIIHLHSKHSWRAMWCNYDVTTNEEPLDEYIVG